MDERAASVHRCVNFEYHRIAAHQLQRSLLRCTVMSTRPRDQGAGEKSNMSILPIKPDSLTALSEVGHMRQLKPTQSCADQRAYPTVCTSKRHIHRLFTKKHG